MTSRDLSQVSAKELKEFLDSFDSVLCDCDGVIILMFTPIPGAKEGIDALKNLGKEVRFVSNNCTQTLEKFSFVMKKLGVDANKEDIVVPTIAVISYLKHIRFEKKVYAIGFKAVRQELADAGFRLADYGPDSVEETIEGIVSQIQDDLDVGAVVVDIDININYIRLQKALVYIKRPDVLFITCSSDMHLPIVNGAIIMGGGYFQNALQDHSGRSPLKFGKPGKYYNDYILDRYKVVAERTLFIGDTFSDMEFARDGCYQKLMVLTGVVKEKDLKNCRDESILPKYFIQSLGELHRVITDKL